MNLINKQLTPNPYSRPQRKLNEIKGLVLHWVGNPGTSALFNRRYFEKRKSGKNGYGSAHYIVDLNGDVVLCIPPNEMAYHVGADHYSSYAFLAFGPYPNDCTLGIEMCHTDWEGRYTEETVGATMELCACLSEQFNLDPVGSITTHHAITGKICPKWYVNHPEDLTNFCLGVEALGMQLNAEIQDWSDS